MFVFFAASIIPSYDRISGSSSLYQTEPLRALISALLLENQIWRSSECLTDGPESQAISAGSLRCLIFNVSAHYFSGSERRFKLGATEPQNMRNNKRLFVETSRNAVLV